MPNKGTPSLDWIKGPKQYQFKLLREYLWKRNKARNHFLKPQHMISLHVYIFIIIQKPVIYSCQNLFVGSLLDKFGCKPFILLVCFGQVLADIGIFINCVFIKELPLEFFYIDAIFFLVGGYPIYFMGKVSVQNCNQRNIS